MGSNLVVVEPEEPEDLICSFLIKCDEFGCIDLYNSELLDQKMDHLYGCYPQEMHHSKQSNMLFYKDMHKYSYGCCYYSKKFWLFDFILTEHKQFSTELKQVFEIILIMKIIVCDINLTRKYYIDLNYDSDNDSYDDYGYYDIDAIDSDDDEIIESSSDGTIG